MVGIRGLRLESIKRKIVVILMITSIISIPLSVWGPSNLSENSRKFNLKQGDYTPTNHMHIWSNEDFATLGIPGSGTPEDPYLIEGFEFSTLENDLLYIESTNVHFIVRNNLLSGENSNNQFGIHLQNVQNGLIENNIITNSDLDGISIFNSSNLILRNNVISNNQMWGISLSDSDNIEFINNLIASNGFEGVGSYTSDNNLWVNNTILYNLDHGVRFEFSNSNIFKSNRISLNGASGIWLGEAHNNLIQQNNFSNNAAGIEIANSMNNLIIENDIASNKVGVSLFPGVQNNITNNRITENEEAGIDLGNAIENNIEYNFIDGSANTGINLAGGQDNKIHNNFISNGGDGLTISGGSTTDEITCNLFEENLQSGIALSENTHFELIVQNDFVGNQNSPQATDDGNSNSFQSNYWNELDIQTQSTRYEIAGSSDNADNLSAPTSNTNQQDINSICFVGPKTKSIDLVFEDTEINTILTPNTDNAIIPEGELVLPNSILFIVVLLLLLLTPPTIVLLSRRKSNTSHGKGRPEEVTYIGFDAYEAIGSVNGTPVSGLCKKCGTYSDQRVTKCPSCGLNFL